MQKATNALRGGDLQGPDPSSITAHRSSENSDSPTEPWPAIATLPVGRASERRLVMSSFPRGRPAHRVVPGARATTGQRVQPTVVPERRERRMKNNPPASASNTSAASPAHASDDPGWAWLATVAGAATCLGLAAWVLPLPLVEPLEPEPVADPLLGPAEPVPDVPVLPDPPPPDDPDDAVPRPPLPAPPPP